MTLKRYIAAVILTCGIGAYPGAALAIDCDVAATEREKTVCQSNSLMAFDAALNDAYRGAIGMEDNPAEGDKTRNLRSEQRAWIKAAEQCKADMACIRRLYASRYVSLRAYSDMNFIGMERLAGLADVLDEWVAADPATGGVPAAARSESGNTYLFAVPVSWGKPLPYYEVYFMQAGKDPERITFPDVQVPQELVTEANSGKFAVDDLTITSEARLQGVSFIGLDVVSEAMTGGAGSEWTYRRWRVDWSDVFGVSPSLTTYEIENVRDGYSVEVIGEKAP